MLVFKFQARFKKQGKTRQNTKVAQFCENVSIYDLCVVSFNLKTLNDIVHIFFNFIEVKTSKFNCEVSYENSKDCNHSYFSLQTFQSQENRRPDKEIDQDF